MNHKFSDSDIVLAGYASEDTLFLNISVYGEFKQIDFSKDDILALADAFNINVGDEK